MKCEICGKETDGPVHTCMKPTELKPCPLSEYLLGRRKTIEASIANEHLAGNVFKEGCERTALAEITALECESQKWNTRAETKPETSNDPVCIEDDGCPTELARLQREWRQLRTQLNEALKWKEEDPRMLREQIRVADVAYNHLVQERDSLRSEVNSWKKQYEDYFSRSQQQLSTAVKALEAYGYHHPGCQSVSVSTNSTCACGFKQTLNQLREKGEK